MSLASRMSSEVVEVGAVMDDGVQQRLPVVNDKEETTLVLKVRSALCPRSEAFSLRYRAEYYSVTDPFLLELCAYPIRLSSAPQINLALFRVLG